MSFVPTVDSLELTVTLSSTLAVVELEPGLCVYRLTRGPSAAVCAKDPANRFGAVLASSTEEGFAPTSIIEQYRRGEVKSLSRASDLVLVPSSFPELLRTQGFSQARDAVSKLCDGWWGSKTPYADLVEGSASLDNVLRVDGGSHMVFSRSGEVLPVAKHLDYIEAGLHDGNYDLVKAVEILKNDPRVEFFDGNQRSLSNGSRHILDIPYYNRDEERSQYLCIRFKPTVEDECRLWEAQKAYGTKYPSTMWRQAMRDLDTLGLRAGGAERQPQERVDSEDDNN